MEKKVLLAISMLLLVCAQAMATCTPSVEFYFTRSPLPTSVFVGETLHLPLLMKHHCLKGRQTWAVSEGVTVRAVDGQCPPMPEFNGEMGDGSCELDMAVTGFALSKQFSAWVRYNTLIHKHTSPPLTINVLAHPVELLPVPVQAGARGLPFALPLKLLARYFDENVLAGNKPVISVTPQDGGGLHFDRQTLMLSGTPVARGALEFALSVMTGNTSIGPEIIRVEVGVPASSRPMFREDAQLPAFTVGKPWRFDARVLLAPSSTDYPNDGLRLRIDGNYPAPEWLHVPPDSSTVLEGIAPPESVEQQETLALIASTNTAGDSLSHVFPLKVAFDTENTPRIQPFSLRFAPQEDFEVNLAQYVDDPTHDPALQLILDAVEPMAYWLRLRPDNPQILEGRVPDDAAERCFQLSLRAANTTGGSSQPVVIPLCVTSQPVQGTGAAA